MEKHKILIIGLIFLVLWIGSAIADEPTSGALGAPTIISSQTYRSFSITQNSPVNFYWYLNGTLVQTDYNVISSSYNSNDTPGHWNVTVIATNGINTISHTWNWTLLQAPESIKTKFFKGSVWPLGRPTFPEIAPKIILKAEENFLDNITFTWMKQEGEANITIQSKDGTLIFEQPILLNYSNREYPLETYEAFVYFNPLVIANGNSSLSFDLGVPYQGTATFKDGKISFLIERIDDSKNTHQNKTLTEAIKEFAEYSWQIVVIIAIIFGSILDFFKFTNMHGIFLNVFKKIFRYAGERMIKLKLKVLKK